MTHSTENAQRHLLEALAVLDSVEDGTAGLLFGIEVNVPIARLTGQPEIAEVYAVLGDLATARRADEDVAIYQRRLLEVLATVDGSGVTGMGRLLIGLREAAGRVRREVPELGHVFDALADLAEAIQVDLKESGANA